MDYSPKRLAVIISTGLILILALGATWFLNTRASDSEAAVSTKTENSTVASPSAPTPSASAEITVTPVELEKYCKAVEKNYDKLGGYAGGGDPNSEEVKNISLKAAEAAREIAEAAPVHARDNWIKLAESEQAMSDGMDEGDSAIIADSMSGLMELIETLPKDCGVALP